ncbi:hypothetical protein [Heyndrickxia acidicola]|uniref:Uncharacterized protein n=1 Tax=Heyndrickxia acidicola TaxID=209389 RepID=A0ABU6MAU4_9BACI|nr:hypothetical protein [Heyndrickxia acidicola]MED1201791.1 hypothetical protein [Heyndrickxia acidicola]
MDCVLAVDSLTGILPKDRIPLSMVTNALSGENMGRYFGLFNGSICLPQIVASCLSFVLFLAIGASIPALIFGFRYPDCLWGIVRFDY